MNRTAGMSHSFPLRNRLTITLLLLWITTTSAVLAYLHHHKPPPPERIGFASFIHSGDQASLKVAMEASRQRLWRAFQMRYVTLVAAAPVYGAALAGLALAAWRLVTRRFGFPVEAGHWLLLAIASLVMLLAAYPYLDVLRLGQNGPDFLVVAAMLLVLLMATIATREAPHWRCMFAIAAAGVGLLSVGFLVDVIWPSREPSAFIALAPLPLAIVPVAAVGCTFVDMLDGERHDILHWIGVATLFGFLAHLAALWGVSRYLS
jgi:hypothetical protein